jgi:hypothetical protein
MNTGFKPRRLYRALALSLAAVLCFAGSSRTISAQSGGTIEAGTSIAVRTNEEIVASSSDGRVFTGSVDQDVRDSRGQIAIPRGAYVELMVKRNADNDYVLDLDSVTINGRRMGVDAATTVKAEKEGLGINDRTGKYVGGGAVIGAIIGAIAGGGKGAAIGGATGAAAGAGAQVLTRGKSVNVPSESLVNFRLEQALSTTPDTGFSRNGVHYHNGYGTEVGNTGAYEAGLKAGRADKRNGRTFNSGTTLYRGRKWPSIKKLMKELLMSRCPGRSVEVLEALPSVRIATSRGRAPRHLKSSFKSMTIHDNSSAPTRQAHNRRRGSDMDISTRSS